MILRSKLFVVALVVVALIAASTSAATVTFTLIMGEDDLPLTFNVYAEASLGDNGGIAGYEIPIVGPVLSINHMSPNTLFASTPGFGPAGFTSQRSPDGAQLLTGRQDTITPTPNIVHGFGQFASSFIAQGITPGAPPEQPFWGMPLLIASGTYDQSQGELEIGETDANLVASVLVSSTSNQIMAADCVVCVFNNFPPGDLNFDSNVDAADYVYWRKYMQNSQQRFNEWRAHFGEMQPDCLSSAFNSSVVPEPAANALLLAMVGWLVSSRRSRP
jgi:hypothetical protein